MKGNSRKNKKNQSFAFQLKTNQEDALDEYREEL